MHGCCRPGGSCNWVWCSMSRNPTLIDDEVEQEDDEPTEQGGDQSSDKQEGGSGDEQGTKGSGSDADSSEEEEGGNEYDVTDNFIAPEGEGAALQARLALMSA